MMRTGKSVQRNFVLAALATVVILTVPGSGFAAVSDPDIPSVKAMPEPRSITDEIKLANDYFTGHGVGLDLKQSAYWFRKAAESGDPQAEAQIGYFYDAGIGVESDPRIAAHWYQLAAAGGLTTAKVNLAVLYLWGTGVEKNQQLGMQLLREAAMKGNGLAACDLGDMYSLGIGVPRDRTQGEQWYVKGAELHDPQAEFDLGQLFFNQTDHPHDQRKAASLFRQSVAAGYVPAMTSLGLLLVHNPALAHSKDEATQLLKKAAEAGIWKSSMILGVLERDGKGQPADPREAYYRFRIAGLQGGKDVDSLLQNDLKDLAARLGPAQTAALDSRAEDWYRQHHLVLSFVYKESGSGTLFPNYAIAVPVNGSHASQMVPAIPE